MTFYPVSELNSSGSASAVTGSIAPGTEGKPDMGEHSGKRSRSSPKDADSFLPTAADVLSLLQDDVHLLSKLMQVEIVPRLHPYDACAIVLYGVTIQDGRFVLLAKEVPPCER